MFKRAGWSSSTAKLGLLLGFISPLLASSLLVASATSSEGYGGQPEDGALAATLLADLKSGLRSGQGIPVLVVRYGNEQRQQKDELDEGNGREANSSSASSSSSPPSSSASSSPSNKPNIYLSWLNWSGLSGFSSYLEPLQSLNSITQPISDAIFKAIPGSQSIFEQFDQAGDTISGMFNPTNLISALGATSSGSRRPKEGSGGANRLTASLLGQRQR